MNSNNFASIARKKLTAGEMRFARKWGAVAVILASLLTLSIVMLIAGQYASSRSDIEGFILKDETLVSTRADYDKQKIKVDEKQAQLKAEEDVKAALTNERESLLVKRAEAIEAIAEKNTDTLTDINAEISRLNEDIKAADAVIESLAADKNVFSANIKIIEDTFSFLEKARTSITRKALTQQTNSLTACTDAIAALSEDEDANSEDIQALNALKDQLAQEIAAFEASIQAIQVENAALLEEAVREDRTSLQEIESKINDAEETKKALAEQLSAVSVNLSDILENLALADEGIQSLDKTLLGLNQSIEAADAKVQTLSRESSDEAIELNRLRILYTNAEIAVNNIGISRFLAYVRMALTSPVYVAPLAAAVLAIAAFLLIRFRFFSRAAASYQTRLGDESKKRIRSSIVLMFVLALLIAIALTLLSTGEYDRAGERLNGYAARSQAVTDAEAQVKKAKTSLDNYTQLTSLLENEEFSGKGELNSKQKSIYNKALKSAGLKESQITKGAENRAENAQLLIDIILTESKGEEAELTEAKLQLEKAESEYSSSFFGRMWSNFVRFIASNLMIVLYVSELIMLIAITFMACFKNRTSISGTLFNANNYIIVSLCAFITIAPFFYVVGASFATEYELQTRPMFIIPQDFSVDAYKYIMSSNKIIRSMGNSVFITVCGTAINLFFTMTMAYVLSKRYLHGRNFFLNMVIISMFFSGGMIPGYILVSNWLKMKNTYWSVILPGAISAYNLMIVKNFFQGLPQELEESARIDGCNEIGTLIRIVLPLSLPVIATFGLFYAVGHWNSYFSAMIYMTGASEKWPLQVILREIIVLSEASAGDLAAMDPNFVEPPQQSIKMAVIVVSTVPIMCVYPFLQKYFVKGVMVGALKG